MAYRRSSKLKKLFLGLMALVFGGGTGVWGWIDPEAPVIGAVVQKLRGVVPGDLSKASPVLSILAPRDPFTQPGTFEVTIAKITVDPAELREGHHVDLQVRVSKKLANGQVQSIWDSRYAGERIALVGREPVTATWSDKPFLVTWQTGEEFSIEVWDRKAIFDKTLYLLDTTNGDREFPLRSDTTTFAHLANGRRTANVAMNSLRVEAKRVSDAK
jgi:hypothetical protein